MDTDFSLSLYLSLARSPPAKARRAVGDISKFE